MTASVMCPDLGFVGPAADDTGTDEVLRYDPKPLTGIPRHPDGKTPHRDCR